MNEALKSLDAEDVDAFFGHFFTRANSDKQGACNYQQQQYQQSYQVSIREYLILNE